ncbi:MAG: hypothetical protein JWL81_1916 [Verrucomicrobiales bacterium]|nr:hypothetical protein [Verrucomicrobiales bacterium]
MKIPRLPLLLLLFPPALQAADAPGVSALPHLPALSPEEALKSFRLSPGFTISAAAVEPQVVDPVSMSFDNKGALYVAEMRDYSERSQDKLSRVRRLTDKDGDGVFETAAVFMDGLAWATSVCCQGDAVYVAATPDIWRLKDTDDDGVADVREVLFTGFGDTDRKLNVQALVNSLTVGPDGWIHGVTAANGGRIRRPGTPDSAAKPVTGKDFAFDPATLEFKTKMGGGQYGMDFDRWGRRFTCSNSHHIQWFAPLPQGGRFSPREQLSDIAEDGAAAPIFRLSPDEPWRVLRTYWRASGLVAGLVEGNGKASGYFTSASGIHFWRDDAIIADCGSNLVHRKTFRETVDGPVAVRPEQEKAMEFLASTDTWFRPVSFATAPDGSLLIADMYREFIEHPDSLPPNLKSVMDLNSGSDRGRIWRVTAAEKTWPPRTPPDPLLTEIATTPEADRPAHWARWWKASGGDGRAATTLLRTVENPETATAFYSACASGTDPDGHVALAAALRIPAPENLRAHVAALLAQTGLATPARIHALTVSSRSGKEDVTRVALDPKEPESVRIPALSHSPKAAGPLMDQWAGLTPNLRRVALSTLSLQWNGQSRILEKLSQGKITPGDIPLPLAGSMRKSTDPAVRELAMKLLPPPAVDRAAVVASRQGVLNLDGNADKGFLIFQQHCATCHTDTNGGAGKGLQAPGPDRTSFRNKGKPMLLLAILDPDREFAPQSARVTLTFKNGTTDTGVMDEENHGEVRILQSVNRTRTARRSDLDGIARAAASYMPTGVEAGLSDQDLADLLAWLVR